LLIYFQLYEIDLILKKIKNDFNEKNCITDVDIRNNVETDVSFVLRMSTSTTYFIFFNFHFEIFLALVLDPFDVVTIL